MVCPRNKYERWTVVHVFKKKYPIYIECSCIYIYSDDIPIDIPFFMAIFSVKSPDFPSPLLRDERHEIHGRHQDGEHGTNGHQKQVQPLLLLEMTREMTNSGPIIKMAFFHSQNDEIIRIK